MGLRPDLLDCDICTREQCQPPVGEGGIEGALVNRKSIVTYSLCLSADWVCETFAFQMPYCRTVTFGVAYTKQWNNETKTFVL